VSVSRAQRSTKWCAAEPGPFTYSESLTIPDQRSTASRCTASGKCNRAVHEDSHRNRQLRADRSSGRPLLGAQTERSRNNFRIGDERMPRPLIAALALVKRAAAEVNRELGLLDARRAKRSCRRRTRSSAQARRSISPCGLQTGSGTQTNMNVNEVIANRANELLTGKLGAKDPVHPNDHVNMSQSSNDSSRRRCISRRRRKSSIGSFRR